MTLGSRVSLGLWLQRRGLQLPGDIGVQVAGVVGEPVEVRPDRHDSLPQSET